MARVGTRVDMTDNEYTTGLRIFTVNWSLMRAIMLANFPCPWN